MAIHSRGYVVGVNRDYPTVQVLKLPERETPEGEDRWAHLPLGPGVRAGLVKNPEPVAIAPNQTILVLESGNSRIQAFSSGLHPVQAFPPAPSPYWIDLVRHADPSVEVKYLALCVEVEGYIYVLSQRGSGYEADRFDLDIYAPTRFLVGDVGRCEFSGRPVDADDDRPQRRRQLSRRRHPPRGLFRGEHGRSGFEESQVFSDRGYIPTDLQRLLWEERARGFQIRRHGPREYDQYDGLPRRQLRPLQVRVSLDPTP